MAKGKVNISAALGKAAALGAGAVGAQAFESVAGKLPVINKIAGNPVLMGVTKVALGTFVPGLISKNKNEMLDNAGAGMVAVGALQLARKLFPSIVAPIAGIDDVLSGIGDDEEYTMSGADDEDEISGTGSPNVIYGTEDVG